jgi:hypothetical protein
VSGGGGAVAAGGAGRRWRPRARPRRLAPRRRVKKLYMRGSAARSGGEQRRAGARTCGARVARTRRAPGCRSRRPGAPRAASLASRRAREGNEVGVRAIVYCQSRTVDQSVDAAPEGGAPQVQQPARPHAVAIGATKRWLQGQRARAEGANGSDRQLGAHARAALTRPRAPSSRRTRSAAAPRARPRRPPCPRAPPPPRPRRRPGPRAPPPPRPRTWRRPPPPRPPT